MSPGHSSSGAELGWERVWASHCSWDKTLSAATQVACTGLHGLGLQASWSPGPFRHLQHKPTPSRVPKSPDGPESAQSEEEVDELSLIDHNEIMARLTLKQEVSPSQAFTVQHRAHDEGEGTPRRMSP